MSDERVDALDALARAHGADPDELRQEVARFRVALDADLTIAAAAARADEPSIATNVLDDDVETLPGFERRLLARVSELVRARRSATRRRVATVAVAAGLVGMLGGAAIATTAVGHSGRRPAVTRPASAPTRIPAQVLADDRAGTLVYATEHGLPTAAIVAASGALQAALAPLMAQAPHDGALAARLRSLLTAARAALATVSSPDAQLIAAIRSTDALLARLTATGTGAATPAVPGTLPTVPGGGPAGSIASTPAVTSAPAAAPTPAGDPTPEPTLSFPAAGSAGTLGTG